MKQESIFLEHVGNSPRMRILEHFIAGRHFDYTLTDLLNADVSWGTINKIVPELVKLGIVKKIRKIGRITLYQINEDNLVAKHFIQLDHNLLMADLKKRAARMKKEVEISA